MTRMSEDTLRAITDAEMRQAVGYWSGKLAQQRQRAMVYYLGLAKNDLAPPEVEGRSSVVFPDVRNTIESMMPQLVVKFAGSEHVVEFQATKPGDEQKAEQATDYINHIFYVDNAGEKVAYTWMKDALLSKNGIVKCWWDDRFEEKSEEYRGLSDVELAMLNDDDEVTITESATRPDEEDAKLRQKAIEQLSAQLEQANQAAEINPQAAQAAARLQQQIQGIQSQPQKVVYDVTVIRKTGGGKVCVENVPPEEFLISRRAKSIEDAPFVGHRVARTVSQLRSMGYKNVDSLGSDDNATALNMERVERMSYDDELAYIQVEEQNSMDDTQRMVWVTECYIRVDFDGDGIAELRKVVRAGGQILENEICDVAPFVSITPVPMPHKFFGLSVADLAMEGQRVNTALLRGLLDNMYLQVNGRYFAVEGQVNLDDLLSSRPGGVVRMKQRDMAGRLDQGMGDAGQAMQLMEYMRGFVEESTGWSRASQGNDPSGLRGDVTATQAQIITNKADMRLDLIARNCAEGFVDLFRMMLKLVSQYQGKSRAVKLRGNWVPVNPREWANGFSCDINVGLGTGDKNQLGAQLIGLIQQQQMGLQDGTATPQNLYESRKELVKAIGFKSAERFFTDPTKVPPKEPQASPDVMAKTQADMQAKQMQLQQDAQHFQADMQLKMQAQQMAHDARMAEIQKQYELQASNDQRDAQREQMKAAYEAQRAQAEQENAKVIQAMKGELEKYKADLDAQVKLAIAQQSAAPPIDIAPIQSALDQMIAHLAAPVEIIRGPDGKAVGVKKGDLVKQIQRGPDGRAVGVQ